MGKGEGGIRLFRKVCNPKYLFKLIFFYFINISCSAKNIVFFRFGKKVTNCIGVATLATNAFQKKLNPKKAIASLLRTVCPCLVYNKSFQNYIESALINLHYTTSEIKHLITHCEQIFYMPGGMHNRFT